MTTRIRLQEAFKFALSMVLIYWLALAMEWDLARYGALAIALISLSTSGASLNKGMMRVVGTVIACVVGLTLVQWFSQARWSMMLALASYLVFISYFLQTSRYPYAWYVAGFVPVVIWADSYGSIDNAFHFAIFRLLETAAGVMIYSIVSVLLWPQTSEKPFYQQGEQYLDHICQLIRLYRDTVHDAKSDDAARTVRRQLDVLSTPLQATLRTALIDSMVVREQQHEWAAALITLRALSDHLALWRTADAQCRRFDQQQDRLDLAQALETIEQRCGRIGELWRSGPLPGDAPESDDRVLLQALSLDRSPSVTMNNATRGLLINRIDQLHDIDQLSRELLSTLRRVAGLDPATEASDRFETIAMDRPPRWDSERLVIALIPAVSFIIGFLFWIYPINPPPGGQSIAEMSGIFGLMVALGANMRYLGLIWAASGLLVIAPLYFVVMPWLDGGAGLLTMIFLLSFSCGYLGGRWPMLKTSVMVLFVMTTDISNDQSYSFMGWVNVEFMMIMAGLIVNLVVMLMMARPEKRLPRRISRFFHACAAASRDFVIGTEKKHPKERLAGAVKRAPGELRAIDRTVDYSRLPTHSQHKINRLLDLVEGVAARLRLVDQLVARVAANGSGPPLGTELPRRLQKRFEQWAKITTATSISAEEKDAVNKQYDELEQRLAAYQAAIEAPEHSEQMVTDLTALLGGVRGLLDVMIETDRAIGDIQWERLAEARF